MAEKKFVKIGRSDGPTLWQIYFEGKDTDAEKEQKMNTLLNPLEGHSGDEEEEEEEVDVNGYMLSGPGKDVVVFETRNDQNGDLNGKEWEHMETDTKPKRKKIPFLGKKFLIRTDSDLELALPAPGFNKFTNSCHYCCVGCPKGFVWRDYIWILLGTILFLAVWAGILTGIIMGLT
ncbi:hypothetical protein CAPTEDRAFT_219992 [Capitella teleta]|uniref:Uncharacterized protein n=1 Tax=Capitella teleta TaxID=283909 RepID=R7VLN7_CAPTE|nr:hypothetical protein CAPTEDRAFT_219992 [Capitella teleta]|eukprot:ELU18451.1 hypothetical protein CAPTEDRAFT_219992 [Capitella teleta]